MKRANGPLLLVGSMLCACCLLFGFGQVRSASAHDELISTSPADGSSHATAPTAVGLKFSDTVLALGSEVVVKTAAGADWVAGQPVISGSTVTARLRPSGPAGKYTVAWRVVSADGHPISGTFAYTVTRGASAAPTSQPSSSPPSAAATTPVSASADPSPAGGTRSDSGGDGMSTGASWGVGAAAIVAAVGAVILVSRRKKQ